MVEGLWAVQSKWRTRSLKAGCYREYYYGVNEAAEKLISSCEAKNRLLYKVEERLIRACNLQRTVVGRGVPKLFKSSAMNLSLGHQYVLARLFRNVVQYRYPDQLISSEHIPWNGTGRIDQWFWIGIVFSSEAFQASLHSLLLVTVDTYKRSFTPESKVPVQWAEPHFEEVEWAAGFGKYKSRKSSWSRGLIIVCYKHVLRNRCRFLAVQ